MLRVFLYLAIVAVLALAILLGALGFRIAMWIIIAVLLVLAISVGAYRMRATMIAWVQATPWRWIFFYNLIVIVVLAVLAVLFIDGTIFPTRIPDRYRLPVHCAWFGALGGVVISLKGVYDHASQTAPNPWNDRFNLWHLGRPVSGAVTGLVTFFLLLAINPNGNLTPPVVYAAAFILGTQERRFFNFLYEVARLIVQVPNEPAGAVLGITDIQPTRGHANGILVVRGTGFDAHLAVRLDGNALGNIVVSSDGTAAAGVVPQHLPGPVSVTVVNPGGKSFVRDAGFTYE